jgi:hypothetical protein
MGDKRMHPEPHRFAEKSIALRPLMELGTILLLSVVVFFLAASFDIFEGIVAMAQRYEAWQLDELIVVAMFLAVAMTAIAVRRWLAFMNINAVISRRNSQLERAVAQLNTLNGLIPICSACKKIRDDEGFWHQVEAYIETHSHAVFTHGICPECTRMLYPDYFAHKTNRHE